MSELLIARNPDPESRLGFLLRVPLGDGIVLRTAGTWPRTNALFCYPVAADEWPAEPDIVERIPLRACVRRGASIDLVAARSRENRSQLVFTTARGRDAVFWQSPRTRKQARPSVGLPSARASGIPELEIRVDAHERYAYRFASQKVRTVSCGLPCGDYAIVMDGALTAAVERKSISDLISSLSSGRLRYALGELRGVTARRRRRRGSAFADLQAGVRPSFAYCRRVGRTAGSLAQRPHRLLRDPTLGRGMDVSIPCGCARLGEWRGGRHRAHRRPATPSERQCGRLARAGRASSMGEGQLHRGARSGPHPDLRPTGLGTLQTIRALDGEVDRPKLFCSEGTLR